MQSHGKRISDRAAAANGLRRAALAAMVLITAGTLVAACGGGSPGGGVPSLGTHTSGNPSAGSPAAGANEGHEGAPGSKAIAYSACMRSHGVPNFPDPEIHQSADGTSVRMVIRAGTFKGNPKFGSAQQACRKLLPNGGGPPTHQTVTPQEQEQYLRAAACIRSHGVPNLPDPTFSACRASSRSAAGARTSSPAFRAAVHDCESLIPGVHDDSGHTQQAAPGH